MGILTRDFDFCYLYAMISITMQDIEYLVSILSNFVISLVAGLVLMVLAKFSAKKKNLQRLSTFSSIAMRLQCVIGNGIDGAIAES